jgi:hypothetical protein
MEELLDPKNILSAEICASKLAGFVGPIHACYVLWHKDRQEPVYCGVSRTSTRITRHLAKDWQRDGRIGKTHVNPPFLAYVMAMPRGWLGVTFRIFGDINTAREVEQAIIDKLGLRTDGGLLFNRKQAA